MALLPSLRPFVIATGAPHTLDIFIDYVCPFSAKIVKAIDKVVLPSLAPGGKYHGKVQLVIRNQLQSWHASTTFVHEASIAVARVNPSAFWPFTLALMEVQTDFFDVPTENLTPLQIRAKLADVAAKVLSAKEVEQFKELLVLKSGGLNPGVAVSDDLKYTIKFSRQNGIHVSPSGLWDGLLVPELSSGWGAEEWDKFFSSKITE